jgi:rSAM/selenodomain-associated transferase 1
MRMDRALLTFIKNPIPGKVKTRLAATVGPETALKIYDYLLGKTRQTALSTSAHRMVFYSDFIPTADTWENHLFEKFRQEGDDLGKRMHHALDLALRRFEKAILIGGDIPGLTPEILENAFQLLDEAPVVWGPAADGGYYLVGLRQSNPSLFELDAWSTPDVMDRSLDKCRQAGLSWRLLPVLQDVDTEGDWQAVTADLQLDFRKDE